MKAKIQYPIEVIEVQIAASGGHQSAEGPGKKKLMKNSEICNFLSYANLIHLKRKLRTIVFQIWNKIFMKKLKKIRFCDFRSQKIINPYWSQLNFWKNCQDSKKITWLPILFSQWPFDVKIPVFKFAEKIENYSHCVLMRFIKP